MLPQSSWFIFYYYLNFAWSKAFKCSGVSILICLYNRSRHSAHSIEFWNGGLSSYTMHPSALGILGGWKGWRQGLVEVKMAWSWCLQAWCKADEGLWVSWCWHVASATYQVIVMHLVSTDSFSCEGSRSNRFVSNLRYLLLYSFLSSNVLAELSNQLFHRHLALNLSRWNGVIPSGRRGSDALSFTRGARTVFVSGREIPAPPRPSALMCSRLALRGWAGTQEVFCGYEPGNRRVWIDLKLRRSLVFCCRSLRVRGAAHCLILHPHLLRLAHFLAMRPFWGNPLLARRTLPANISDQIHLVQSFLLRSLDLGRWKKYLTFLLMEV